MEPGLFECTGWYTVSETSNVLTMPRFMTKKEYLENKYPIDKQYRENMTITELSQLETELEFYQRSHAVTANILKMHENEYITQIQQGQASIQNQVHILFIGKYLHRFYFVVNIDWFFSTCTQFRNLHTKVMWRQISSRYIATCYKKCGFSYGKLKRIDFLEE